MSSDRLFIFDTTLRDGEQSPGASMTKEEKMRIARLLEKLKVDVIEAGFPLVRNSSFEKSSAGNSCRVALPASAVSPPYCERTSSVPSSWR